jgi:ribonuclease-3 family protein
MAKNATVADYRRATGFEALVGYLYLSGQMRRLVEIVRIGITYERENR